MLGAAPSILSATDIVKSSSMNTTANSEEATLDVDEFLEIIVECIRIIRKSRGKYNFPLPPMLIRGSYLRLLTLMVRKERMASIRSNMDSRNQKNLLFTLLGAYLVLIPQLFYYNFFFGLLTIFGWLYVINVRYRREMNEMEDEVSSVSGSFMALGVLLLVLGYTMR